MEPLSGRGLVPPLPNAKETLWRPLRAFSRLSDGCGRFIPHEGMPLSRPEDKTEEGRPTRRAGCRLPTPSRRGGWFSISLIQEHKEKKTNGNNTLQTPYRV